MRIAITGARGFLGQQIVPVLLERGASLLLIGRQGGPDQMSNGLPVVGYEEIARAGANFHALIHLAVLNNDKSAPAEEFIRVNADLAVQTCIEARAANIGRFYFISSTHALDETNKSAYAESKRIAAERLRAIDGIVVEILFLPAILGDKTGGKLKALNRLPSPLRAIALPLAQALKPTVDINRFVDRIISGSLSASPPFRLEIIANPQAANPAFRFAKRLLDVVLSLGVIVALWWLMIIVWVVIRVQSAGPGIFAQERVGQDQRVFTCYKFRTMYASTPDIGTHEVSLSAVTPFGHFLRGTKIDELPQVINILKNEMSFVGPRPCLPSQSALIKQRRLRGIFDVKPGITGLAQVRRVDMSDPERITEWDYRYIGLQSLVLDFKILLATAMGKGSGDRIDAGPARSD